MTAHFIKDLEIIGFTEVPSMEPALPRILSAIYRDPKARTVLYPPYQMIEGDSLLVKPVEAPFCDFEERANLADLTPYGPIQAQAGCALWLDDSGRVHYEPKRIISQKLSEIFDRRMAEAKKLLDERKLEEARTSALIASASAPQNIEPLVIRAAAEYGMSLKPDGFPNALAELNLTEFLASELMIPPNLFVAAYRQMYGGELRNPCKIKDLATRKIKKTSKLSELQPLAA